MEDNEPRGADVPTAPGNADNAALCLQDNADDAQQIYTITSQHSHVEQECKMASEIGPSSDYGGMLNYTLGEFTEQDNLSIGQWANVLYLRKSRN